MIVQRVALITVHCSLFTLLAGCGQGEYHEAQSVGEAEHGELHWSSQGEEGREHCAQLSPDFRFCGEVVGQSPIDLTGAVPIEDTRLERRIGTEVQPLGDRELLLVSAEQV